MSSTISMAEFVEAILAKYTKKQIKKALIDLKKSEFSKT